MRTLYSLWLAAGLAACGEVPDGAPPPRQITLDWPEQHRLLVADSRQGVVRAFSTFDAPRAAGEARAGGRSAVLAMVLDKEGSRLWVLGPRGAYLHDAVSLALLRVCPPGHWPPDRPGEPCPG